VARLLVSILWPVDAWPQSDPFTLGDELTIADAAMVYSDRHPRQSYWYGRGPDNPSPINPREPAGVDQIEKMIGKGATKDLDFGFGFGSGALENWQKSWSVYCTLVDNVKKGLITPIKRVYLADGSINRVLTEIWISALLDLARQRGDPGEILSSLLTWYEAPELEAKSSLATESTLTTAETGSVEPSSPQRGAYRGALAAWLADRPLTTLLRMTPEAIASHFKLYCEQKTPELLPLLPKRLRSMEPFIERIVADREAKAKGGTRQNKGR
jgi:hypothetical protein